MTHAILSGWRFIALLLVMLLSAVGYLAFSLWGGYQEVVYANPYGFYWHCYHARVLPVNYGLHFLRWKKYLALLRHYVYWLENLRIYIAGFDLTVLPIKVGETIRNLFLKQHGVSYPESLVANFSEHLSNLISMLLLVAIGLLAYPQAKPLVVILAVLILVILIFFSKKMAESDRGFCAK